MEKPRERILKFGAKSLSNRELLAILLRTGRKEVPVMVFATELLIRFPTWTALLTSSPEELLKNKGLGKAKVATLLAIREILYRFGQEHAGAEKQIETPRDSYELFADLAHEPQEVLAAIFLDTRDRMIRRVDVFRGALNYSVAQPREILREALRANAAKILVAHNHPSQDPSPSEEDQAFTRRLKRSAELCGLELADHLIICTGNRYYSFSEDSRI